MNQICTKCKIEKEIHEFNYKSYYCKKCKNLYLKEYHHKNKEKLKLKAQEYQIKNREILKLRCKKYYLNNKKKRKEYIKNNRNRILIWAQKYREKNRNKIREYDKKRKDKRRIYERKYREIHQEVFREKSNKYYKERRKNDINFKILCNLRKRPWNLLKNKNKSQHTLELLGCSLEFFKNHLESKFQPGMTWQNYGYRGWHIDHIRPCASFDLSKAEEQAKCFHYSNLQPLWWRDNIIKSDKII